MPPIGNEACVCFFSYLPLIRCFWQILSNLAPIQIWNEECIERHRCDVDIIWLNNTDGLHIGGLCVTDTQVGINNFSLFFPKQLNRFTQRNTFVLIITYFKTIAMCEKFIPSQFDFGYFISQALSGIIL